MELNLLKLEHKGLYGQSWQQYLKVKAIFLITILRSNKSKQLNISLIANTFQHKIVALCNT